MLIVASAYGHEVLDRRDSDWRTEPAHRDCLLSVSHSQRFWRVFAGRQLVVPFCATAAIAMDGNEVTSCPLNSATSGPE